MRIFLPQQFMTDVDGLHGSFLATDENGQRLFAITSSDGTTQNAALTIVQLASVPLGIGTILPSTVSATGVTLTIRGSGFVSGLSLAINGKAATVTFKDVNTLSVTIPALTPGPQQITITNPEGETVSLDAAITANQVSSTILFVSFNFFSFLFISFYERQREGNVRREPGRPRASVRGLRWKRENLEILI